MKKNLLAFSVLLFLGTHIASAQTTVNFSQKNVVQNWTVPAGITTATITVAGAAGGSYTGQGTGGNGTSLTGICTITPGHKLSIVAGSMGVGASSWGSGGGGGSYIYDSNTITLLIVGAGGGGGGSAAPAYNSNGGTGGIDISTNATTNEQPGEYNGAGGTVGNGGSPDDGGGGAGWISNGGNGNFGAGGGNDRANLFVGGTGAGGNMTDGGGYGGGGGGGDDGAGGGGGYNGGGGGEVGNGGGGGGSYLNGTVVGTPVANNTSNGYVSIKYGSTTAINNLTSNSGMIRIYPNPSNGIFTIKLPVVDSRLSVEVYNVLGERVYYTIQNLLRDDDEINLSSQPKGLYFYRVTSESGELIGQGKLIIQK